ATAETTSAAAHAAGEAHTATRAVAALGEARTAHSARLTAGNALAGLPTLRRLTLRRTAIAALRLLPGGRTGTALRRATRRRARLP
ncbi:hypothetical protein, partial [Paenibacillus phytohabitans]|uniref:hypothetical protein n=1 Tax=Paenibacillus phytohabitans TaxID=2654978 RepID=UPI0030082300